MKKRKHKWDKDQLDKAEELIRMHGKENACKILKISQCNLCISLKKYKRLSPFKIERKQRIEIIRGLTQIDKHALEIAKELNVSREKIVAWSKKGGIELQKGPRKKRKKESFARFWTEEKLNTILRMIEQGYTAAEIGNSMGKGRSTISMALKNHGLNNANRLSKKNITELRKCGRTMTIKELSEKFNIKEENIRTYLRIHKISFIKKRPQNFETCGYTYKVIENNCHICTSHKYNRHGHVYLRLHGRNWYIRRAIYEKYVGKIPEGYIVMTNCTNSKCLNPEHMYITKRGKSITKDKKLYKIS